RFDVVGVAEDEPDGLFGGDGQLAEEVDEQLGVADDIGELVADFFEQTGVVAGGFEFLDRRFEAADGGLGFPAFSGDLTNSPSDQAEAGDHRVGEQGVQGGGDSAEDEEQTACGFVESDDVLDKGAEPGDDVADGGAEPVGRFPESACGVDGPVEQFGDPFDVAAERSQQVP